ncbi:hypothetical protein MYP_3744 [Sporocytophaga myxococcoides]|uniref:Uncharacterized protein n=1 Tax=Sporocytophaga myxococcoides TaxID=153721 RepID=A0A098LJ73_9BACT|nr:hypothetical protein MYP_3744 [Sporocytophaga myxococcoides]
MTDSNPCYKKKDKQDNPNTPEVFSYPNNIPYSKRYNKKNKERNGIKYNIDPDGVMFPNEKLSYTQEKQT